MTVVVVIVIIDENKKSNYTVKINSEAGCCAKAQSICQIQVPPYDQTIFTNMFGNQNRF